MEQLDVARQQRGGSGCTGAQLPVAMQPLSKRARPEPHLVKGRGRARGRARPEPHLVKGRGRGRVGGRLRARIRVGARVRVGVRVEVRVGA